MIEIFRTNVASDQQAEEFIGLLEQYFPGAEVNFDLTDCDNILRIKGDRLDPDKIRHIARASNIIAELLD